MSPIRAPNTNNIQLNIQISIAVRPKQTLYLTWQDCRQVTFSLGSVGGDVVEDVDENKEQGDEEGHTTRNNLKWTNHSPVFRSRDQY